MSHDFVNENLMTTLDVNDRRLPGSHALQTTTLQTAINSQLTVRVSASASANHPPLNGAGGQKTFQIDRASGNTIIENFGGVGSRSKQTATVLAEIDTLTFEGAGLTARNLLLTQQGSDLVLSFERVPKTQEGSAGNDTLWGASGQDILTGGSGSDAFVLTPREGTDIIKDFKLSDRDRLGLAVGLTFDQLTITQGSGSNANNVLLGTKTGERLASLNGVLASTLNNSALTLTDTGLATSQGDKVTRADSARSAFGVDGTDRFPLTKGIYMLTSPQLALTLNPSPRAGEGL